MSLVSLHFTKKMCPSTTQPTCSRDFSKTKMLKASFQQPAVFAYWAGKRYPIANGPRRHAWRHVKQGANCPNCFINVQTDIKPAPSSERELQEPAATLWTQPSSPSSMQVSEDHASRYALSWTKTGSFDFFQSSWGVQDFSSETCLCRFFRNHTKSTRHRSPT